MKFLWIYVLLVCPVCLLGQKPELVVPVGHTRWINSVVFSTDGKFVLTGSGDYSAKLWDLQGNELQTFVGHTDQIISVSLSPDGRQILTGSSDKTAKLWDSQGNEFQTFAGHTHGVTSVTFSPDGSHVLTGSGDSKAKLWDLEGNEIRTFAGHSGGLTSVAFSPDGSRVLTGSTDGTTKIWDLQGNLSQTLGKINSFHTPNVNAIYSVTFSPDGLYVLTGSSDSTAKLWDLQGNELQIYKGHSEEVWSVVFSPDGSQILTGSLAGTVKLWNLQGIELQTFVGHNRGVMSVAFTPDGSRVLTGNTDGTATLLDLQGNQIQRFDGHTCWVSSVVFSSDGNQVLTGSSKTAKIWDFQSNQIRIFSKHNLGVFFVSYSPDGSQILTANVDSTAILWDLNGNKLQTFVGHRAMVYSAAFSPDGSHVLTASWDGIVKLWDLHGNALQTFAAHKAWISSVNFSPNGNRILTGSLDQTAKLWDLQGNELQKFARQQGLVHSTFFSSNGSQILIGGGDIKLGEAKLWDLEGNELQTFKGHNGAIRSISFSLDGSRVLTGSEDYTAKLWDLQGNELQTFIGHRDMVYSAALSPDGRWVITGSGDHTVKLWDINGKELASLISIDSTDWIITTPSGLFDASPGAMDHMYYVIGLEVIELEQLKERYYEPGLLPKLLGFEEGGVRDVSVFDNVALYPEVDASIDNNSLNIQLTERSGGIGKISLFVNQKEQLEDANPDRKTSLTIDLKQFADFYQEGENTISLRAYNEEGWLKSPEIPLNYEPEIKVLRGIPSLYTISIGTSEYNGDYLDLSFAGKDAVAISEAFEAAGEELFQDRVQSYLLSTESGEQAPSKRNIQQAFQSIADQARPQDIVLVYLSGHGVTYGETEKGNFYYLTKDVASEDLSDSEIRRNYAISDEELTLWMNDIPALKQVMIIDACNSGKVVENLLASAKKLDATQIRALDRMKDRTGVYVLAGSAADKVSYEASQFGQGLLTHSILSGMSGRAIQSDGRIDVMDLFQFSRDEVPRLAESINGIQTPMMAFPYGGESFDIGIVKEGTSIPVAASKPVFVRTVFQDEDAFDDVLDLSERFNQYLGTLSDKGRIVYVPVPTYNDRSYSIKGRYTISGDAVTLNARLFRGKAQVAPIQVEGSKGNTEAILKAVMQEVGKHL